ncbi:hypothetical protein D3OALGB2SA_1282 [Olavius algarvensis associated proteobacterium Delta 3]|nr:hypothetical protein D3OALGB2SA_1282 [Olavius algarvensis associated proteobacterium Delta 3]
MGNIGVLGPKRKARIYDCRIIFVTSLVPFFLYFLWYIRMHEWVRAIEIVNLF